MIRFCHPEKPLCHPPSGPSKNKGIGQGGARVVRPNGRLHGYAFNNLAFATLFFASLIYNDFLSAVLPLFGGAK